MRTAVFERKEAEIELPATPDRELEYPRLAQALSAPLLGPFRRLNKCVVAGSHAGFARFHLQQVVP